MSRKWLAALGIVVSISFSGCMGIHQLGPGVQDYCDQCDGCSERPIPCGPLDGMAQIRRSLVCSGGCGEVYYGEWISTPPDCEDPCGDCQEWTGGCREKCLPCGRFSGLLSGLVGKRLRCDDSKGLFDICDLCGQAECESGCDTCSGCDGDEVSYEGNSILLDGGDWSSESVGSELHPAEVGKFKPMPRTRVASARTISPSPAHKPGCNCGKH
jgi:hypothetical protein